ncbi:hypothetical protein [Mycolicibacterium hippocampi]|uniref:Uncharacterized protein n=1 Tax=Mycolicibacterium hippocampi TaxID=659824 RepID=A0A850PM90_9MYCO|nr:hypothetical protein [Mycolicibacterium hippocampi]NVN51452.1 hypothetical protein [Mycolicibacterium hippocampi]
MSVTSKGRAAARQTIRVQRRIALVQALFWPTAITTALVVGVTVALRIRLLRAPAPAPAVAPTPAAAEPDVPVAPRP